MPSRQQFQPVSALEEPDRRPAAGFHVLQAAAFTLLLGSAAVFLVVSRHWPLVGDSAQIHYICFLMDRGMAPYRVTGDMNMPGALLLEWAAMHMLGAGSTAWRCFDLLLAAAATASMAVIAGRGYRLVGVGAGLLFLLLHGEDGLNGTGERDLSIAVLLLLGYAALFRLLRQLGQEPGKPHGASAACFGLAVGAAATLKPTVLPVFLLLLPVLRARPDNDAEKCTEQQFRRARTITFCTAFCGLAVPFAAALVFLLYERALSAFLHGLHTAVPYYASLRHQGLGYLLLHSMSPVLPIFVLWLLGPAWEGGQTAERRLERRLLLVGAGIGLLSYVLQGKGFPYQRYPLLATLLPLMAVDVCRALRMPALPLRTWPWRVRAILAAVALLYAAGFAAPHAAWQASRYHWRDQQFLTSLTGDLRTLHARDGEVQCIDSISGCGNALLRLRLRQSTGLLSDFFIFGPPGEAAVEDARASFQAAVAGDERPRYVIVTDGLHLAPTDIGAWSKLGRWPWLEGWLGAHYTLVLTREPTRPVLWWSRAGWPAAYRVYVSRDAADDAREALAHAAGVGTMQGPLLLAEP